MSKVAVVYWSSTGNTEAMANAIAEGAKMAGADTDIFTASVFDSSKAAEFDAIAFGCPAMGAEELDDTEFEPMFSEVESSIAHKKIALFGSYGWGDGQWMRDWVDRCKQSGLNLINEGLMAIEAPNDADLANCRALGASLN